MMSGFTEKPLVEIISGKIDLQHLKTLERAPQGTLVFRSYLLSVYGNLKRNKAFGGLEATMMEQICYIWNQIDTSGLYGIEIYSKRP